MERANMVAMNTSSNIVDMNVSKEADPFSIMENVVLNGDLSKLTAKDRVFYYNKVCSSLGLNPLTKPFDYLTLKGRTMLYARKDATEQLRKIHDLSIEVISRELVEDIYVVTARASDKNGRRDESIGAINISGLRGEEKANAFMKAETKAKRRVTLSIAGLGIMDETEVSSVAGAKIEKVNIETGEIEAAPKMASKEQIKALKDIVEDCPYDKNKIFEEFQRSGFSSYSKMTAEYADKMIEWLGGSIDKSKAMEDKNQLKLTDVEILSNVRTMLDEKYADEPNIKSGLLKRFFGVCDYEGIALLKSELIMENYKEMVDFFNSINVDDKGEGENVNGE